MQPFGFGLGFFRRTFHRQARAFELNIKVLLAESRHGERNTIVVIVALFDVVRRERLAFRGALQRGGQFVKTNPLAQQRG
ncbi:hypothetical protein D3C78_1569880 [compost metagenome]